MAGPRLDQGRSSGNVSVIYPNPGHSELLLGLLSQSLEMVADLPRAGLLNCRPATADFGFLSWLLHIVGQSSPLVRLWSRPTVWSISQEIPIAQIEKYGIPGGLRGLPSAQVVTPGSRDRVPRRAPCMEPASPSACVSTSLSLSVSHK